jgi:AraC-like DNA-binding protein
MLIRLELERYLVRKDLPLLVIRSDLDDGYEEHTHNFYEMVVILEGTGVQIINGSAFSLHPGMVFLIQDEDRHAFRDCHGLVLYNILSDGNQLREWLVDLRALPGYQYLFLVEPRFFGHEAARPFLTLDHGELTQVRILLETMEREQRHREGGFGLALQGLFFQLATIVVRSYQRRADSGSGKLNRIAAALAKMQRELDQPLSVASLADECNLSVRQFHRLFHQIQGMGPLEWLTRLRVERAELLLARTDDTVTQIAALVGCPDPNYFSRLFRRVVGTSPGNYRRGFRTGELTG